MGRGRSAAWRGLRRLLVGLGARDTAGRRSGRDACSPGQDWTRRRVIQTLGMGALLGGCQFQGAGAPRVAIVGAGLAGLTAAYTLRKAGLIAPVYDAAGRVGGRMLSVQGVLAPGVVWNLGGEFIDSDHRDILALARELQIPLWDRTRVQPRTLDYFVGNQSYSEAQVIEALEPLVPRLRKDYEQVGDPINSANPVAVTLDRLSLGAYLDQLGVQGWLRRLLETAFVSEFGLEVDQQSALNFLLLVGLDVREGFQVYGDSDERYLLQGGSQALTDALAQQLADQIHLEHGLVRLTGDAVSGYQLTLVGPAGRAMEVRADAVILAVPFTTLRQVELQVDLPAQKRRCIAELGYGTHAKVGLGVKRRLWREQGSSGEAFSDAPFQMVWDSSEFQPGLQGGLTLFPGGAAGRAVGQQATETLLSNWLPDLEVIFPGLGDARNGRSGQFAWSTYPYSLGSYSCFQPGQWTALGGAAGRPVGQIHFAGEHCSIESQGYMNGAAETGRRAALGILGRVHSLLAKF
ncbi:MAG: FAD-dependent oxidoreductase [Gloeomargaritaceae cyanobacterium C42_A2020_066]|nr:FAD-dependent oxidoreductase [Gloeomargaritaceae cyanobacterium C42_A2020_066]